MSRFALTVAIVSTFVILACGSDSPTAPTITGSGPANISGTWTGIAEELTAPIRFCTFGRIRVSFAQAGSSLSGTWLISYADSSCDSSGSVTGSITGDNITLTLSPSVPTFCPFRVAGRLTGGNRFLEGSYAASNCSVPSGGSFILEKS